VLIVASLPGWIENVLYQTLSSSLLSSQFNPLWNLFSRDFRTSANGLILAVRSTLLLPVLARSATGKTGHQLPFPNCQGRATMQQNSDVSILQLYSACQPFFAFSSTAHVQGPLMITGNAKSGAPPERLLLSADRPHCDDRAGHNGPRCPLVEIRRSSPNAFPKAGFFLGPFLLAHLFSSVTLYW